QITLLQLNRYAVAGVRPGGGAGRLAAGGRRSGAAALLHQLVDRQVQQIAVALARHHDLAGIAQHILQGLDIQALAHDLRRLTVFADQQVEALGLTLGPRHYRLTIAVGLFEQALGLTAGFRNDTVGIGFGQVALTHLVLPGTDHVIKGILHLRRRLGALDVNLNHGNTGLVGIQIALQTFGGFHTHLLTPFGQYLVHGGRTHNVAQGTLGGMAQAGFRILDLEHEVLQIGDAILHRQRYFDDILVLGQHLTRLTVGTDSGDVTLELLLEGREIHMQARFHGAIVFTQAQNDRLLLLIDHVDGVEQPEHEQQNPADDPDSTGNTLSTTDAPAIAAGAPALLVAENAVQAVLQLAQGLVQVRRPLFAAAVVTAATVTAAPGILVVRIVTATRLIPRHSVLRCQKP